MNRGIQLTIIFFFGFLLWGATDGYAQLSPGELTHSHADLEGIRNCTKCHVLGDKVSNDKCLDCHKVLKSRINARKGYHASREVKGKECASCHSEHHGRQFEMIRFEEKTFDHQLTGYDLTGAHQKIDCRDCHKPDLISDREIKFRKNTYLGLGQECLACHEDSHQKTLGNDCASCHSTDAFAPAARFDHNKTDFALAGKHRDVDCAECHLKEMREGKSFQRFADIPFAQCSSCHDDPHQNQHLKRCDECHTEQAFSDRRQLFRYNHSRTNFPLKGKHRQTACAECHSFDAHREPCLPTGRASRPRTVCSAMRMSMKAGLGQPVPNATRKSPSPGSMIWTTSITASPNLFFWENINRSTAGIVTRKA